MLRHGVDDLGIVHALCNGVDNLRNNENCDRRIQGDLNILKDDDRKGDDRDVDAEHQHSRAQIRKDPSQQQCQKICSAGADPSLQQQSRAEARERAARDRREQRIIGVGRQQQSENIYQHGNGTRGRKRHDKRTALESAPCCKHHPHAHADGREHLCQRRGKTGYAARRNIVRHIEYRDRRRDERAGKQNRQHVQQDVPFFLLLCCQLCSLHHHIAPFPFLFRVTQRAV